MRSGVTVGAVASKCAINFIRVYRGPSCESDSSTSSVAPRNLAMLAVLEATLRELESSNGRRR